ncbi:hypothetical protein DIPPA_31778 [Diplonema papillatum]|nr:hypothetical protein DIPPA_31778 [Diplonema papillatum]
MRASSPISSASRRTIPCGTLSKHLAKSKARTTSDFVSSSSVSSTSVAISMRASSQRCPVRKPCWVGSAHSSCHAMMSRSLRHAQRRYTQLVTVMGRMLVGDGSSLFGMSDTNAVSSPSGHRPSFSTRLKKLAKASISGTGRAFSSSMRHPSTPHAEDFFFLSRRMVRSSSPVMSVTCIGRCWTCSPKALAKSS